MKPSTFAKTLPCLATALFLGTAPANDRHFAFTYETAVLPPGGKELEVWTTLRHGRDEYFSALDQRLEFEVGLTDRLMTAFYLNWTNNASETSGTVGQPSFAMEGVSSEWKWKLMDPVADIFGFGLYAEVGYTTKELELEAKTLFDKKVGKWLLAANLVGEGEYEAVPGAIELEEIEIEVDLGASYAFSPRLSLGMEMLNHNEIAKELGSEDFFYEHSALYVGPTIAYATEAWWMTLSVMPQVPALMKQHSGGILVLDEHEKINARLLFSFHL